MNKHITDNHKIKFYRCDQINCNYIARPEALLEHRKSVHNITDDYSCPSGCEINSEQTGDTVQNTNTDQETNNFSNPIKSVILCLSKECTAQFNSFDNLITHLNLQHPEIKAFKCTRCEYAESSQQKMVEHIKQVHLSNLGYVCVFCNNSLKNLQSLKRHVTKKHRTNIYKCDQENCDYVGNIDQMINHKKDKHDIIEVKFPENFSCPFGCESRFDCYSKSGLHCYKSWSEHIEAIHKNVKMYKCRKCKFSYNQQGDLANHIRKKHPTEKPFPCPFCKSILKTHESFENHIERTHINEKKYTCDVVGCNYSCSLRDHLNTHNKTAHE